MKFEIYSKDLKAAIEKATTCMNKKASMYFLTCYYFIARSGNIYLVTSNLEQSLELKLKADCIEADEGEILEIDLETVKVLTKATDDVTIATADDKCTVSYGKRKVSFNVRNTSYDDIEPMFIKEVDKEQTVTLRESWVYETLVNLATFLEYNETQRMFFAYNFNLTENRVEVLDGHRIAMRELESSYEGSFMLYANATSVMKKVLDKNSDAEVKIMPSKNHIDIEGTDFRYQQRRLEGQYYVVSRILTTNFDTTCIIKTKDLIDICKYVNDIVPAEYKKPLIFNMQENLTCKMFWKYKIEEEIEAIIEGNPLKIGFNPKFLLDMLNLCEDTIKMKFTNMKAPMIAASNGYSFLILPVNISDMEEAA